MAKREDRRIVAARRRWREKTIDWFIRRDNTRLSRASALLFIAMIRRMDEHRCFRGASYARLGEITGTANMRTVRTAIAKLRAAGLIEVQRKGSRPSIYRLAVSPMPRVEPVPTPAVNPTPEDLEW